MGRDRSLIWELKWRLWDDIKAIILSICDLMVLAVLNWKGNVIWWMKCVPWFIVNIYSHFHSNSLLSHLFLLPFWSLSFPSFTLLPYLFPPSSPFIPLFSLFPILSSLTLFSNSPIYLSFTLPPSHTTLLPSSCSFPLFLSPLWCGIFLHRIITSYRTFFMYASSAQEAEDWIKILRWKLVSVSIGTVNKNGLVTHVSLNCWLVLSKCRCYQANVRRLSHDSCIYMQWMIITIW